VSGPPPLPRRMTVRDVRHARARSHLLWSVALLALVLVAAFQLDMVPLTAAVVSNNEPGGK
jgi:hypothetical protein